VCLREVIQDRGRLLKGFNGILRKAGRSEIGGVLDVKMDIIRIFFTEFLNDLEALLLFPLFPESITLD
jgi:hypothetical protein